MTAKTETVDTGMPHLRTVDSKGAAAIIGVRDATMRQMRLRGEGPPWIVVSRCARYRIVELERWMIENEGTEPQPPQKCRRVRGVKA